MRAVSLFMLVSVFAISGCSIKQTVTPATLSAELAPEICMIPAPNLRAGFTTAYQASLAEKGFRTRLMTPGSSPVAVRSPPPLSATGAGIWRCI